MVSLYKNELNQIEISLNESLGVVEDDDIHGRYEMHKMAFNDLMKMVTVYGPLLTSIKEEYESLIGHVMKGQQYNKTMDEELRTACCYPITIENYERRCIELREKLHRLRREREHSLEELRDVQMKCQALRRVMKNIESDEIPTIVPVRREIRRLPCMNLESLTDLDTMQKMCNQLGLQRQQLQRTKATKYADKNEQIQLESQLKEQIKNYDTVRQDVKNLIRRKFLLQAALKQVHCAADCHHFTQNIGEVIVNALVNGTRSIDQTAKQSDEDSIEDEINKFFPESSKPVGSMKESDYIVLCIRQFEKLFQAGNYKDAADLAVIVPRAVLRNYPTLLKFKDTGGHNLLYYCQQIFTTMKTGHLDADMSYECVDIALKEGRIDLINLWISKGRLQSSELIADNLICHADLVPDHKTACLDLSAAIYWDLLMSLTDNQSKQRKKISSENNESTFYSSRRKYFDSILECRIKSGRIEEAVEMLTNENVTPVSARSIETMYKEEDLLLLIHYYPNIDLVHSLLRKKLVSLPSVFKVLLESESYGVLANLLIHNVSVTQDVSPVVEQLCSGIVDGINTEAWEWMLNFVGESNEKIIIEIAASYLVRVSLERSCTMLLRLDCDN